MNPNILIRPSFNPRFSKIKIRGMETKNNMNNELIIVPKTSSNEPTYTRSNGIPKQTDNTKIPPMIFPSISKII